MILEAKTFKEDCQNVKTLADTCLSIKKNLNYPVQDVRNQTLNNIEKISDSSLMILNLLDSWAIESPNQKYVISRLIGLEEPDKSNEVVNMISKMTKLGFVLLSQFQIENCTRTLAKNLGAHSGQNKFYSEAKSLINALNLTQDKLEILNTTALIRNTLHNNRVHYSSHGTKTTVIKEARYEFIIGEHINCATWNHITHALQHSVYVLKEIFQHLQFKYFPYFTYLR
ncbi:MAG: hypothetical protein Q7K34_01795 [archaeon]|nr:hypothetical protein [archaeon]